MRRLVDITANPEHRRLRPMRARLVDPLLRIKLRKLTEEVKLALVARKMQDFIDKTKG